VKILQLMSCRGWSSDAYWAARATCELQARGHAVTLGCRRGTDERVIDRARREGIADIETFAFASGVAPRGDVADVHRLRAWLEDVDVVHVHRGKEHWLAAVANRLAGRRRPLVRTRHIVQVVRAHAGNRWLYRHATSLVIAVTGAIRGQYIAAGLVDPERVVVLHGGADTDLYRPKPVDPTVRQVVGGVPGVPLVGMVAGLRYMKGHTVVVDAAARLAARGIRPHFTFVGHGAMERMIAEAITGAGLDAQFTLAGWMSDLPAVMAAFDIALYVPVESEGMSRVVFEYLAAARPLIASRVGAVPEVLADGRHAALVAAGDAGALAEALERMLADASLRARLAQGARALVVERYSGARVAEALESHYARLLAA
jgi:glycosyltransferase involved in cell wall biosynthesis